MPFGTGRSGVPKAAEPIYRMLEANEPIVPFDGSLIAGWDDWHVAGSGSVRLDWILDPSLRFTIDCDSDVNFGLIRSRIKINRGPGRGSAARGVERWWRFGLGKIGFV